MVKAEEVMGAKRCFMSGREQMNMAAVRVVLKRDGYWDMSRGKALRRQRDMYRTVAGVQGRFEQNETPVS